MSVIVPTVTATDQHTYREQMERVAGFAHRVHIDLADGVFTEEKLIDLKHIWWPVGMIADVHLMYKAAKPYLKQLIQHKPHLVIVHAEAAGNFFEIARPLREAGILVGVALLADTPAKVIKPVIYELDHVLIFSGNLGHFGGHANTDLLSKVLEIKDWSPGLEIGWDGGISADNIERLTRGGIDVLNVGGAIQRAQDPASAYATLKAQAEK